MFDVAFTHRCIIYWTLMGSSTSEYQIISTKCGTNLVAVILDSRCRNLLDTYQRLIVMKIFIHHANMVAQ